MTKLLKLYLFGKGTSVDEREQNTAFEIMANAGILSSIICFGAIIYDVILNKEVTSLGTLSLIILLITSCYIFIMMRIKKVYLRYTSNKTLIRNSIISGFMFYVLYTLLPHLSGEPITMRDLTGNIIWGGLFGLCMYGFGKYNSKKAEEDEL
ncbi:MULTISPECIES: hypothetical protein [Bacillus cereus group]|uniref:Uncharacterized protein n=1 Tax=Bacillus thuringiensis Bt18247 TaxID=1423143 RepID=A0A9W3SUE9_BACTU|nr:MULTISPECIES: hypothetical protein [Bacillus cereus group]AOM11814.1 hypothetical protein BTI247_34310 [Bacillus thuringiensis Bt18247]MBG9523990.1 hypothetical protein [Bacillus thuringiensis]MDA2595657.1 hypothetical protein [Bacillus cereus group sp. Bc061]OPA18474.1 hypothetical protein BHL54_02300 [Bacillus cereus]PFE93053.1 hypothetical protein CN325_21890 [Bacillus thuringiensis]